MPLRMSLPLSSAMAEDDTPPEKRPAAISCGHLPGLLKAVSGFFIDSEFVFGPPP
jgi:hypothetical protein